MLCSMRWRFANKVTYHIDAERNPTGSIVGKIPNKEERSYYKMEVSNYYSTAKLWGTSDKKVSKSSEKNKWKLTDSLKEKIVELAKKDAHDNVYMGNAFMNLRKMEVSKVAPNRAALIGKFNQSMNSGNMSAMKEVEKADKNNLISFYNQSHARKAFVPHSGSCQCHDRNHRQGLHKFHPLLPVY